MKSLAAILVLLALAGCSTDSRIPEFIPAGAIVRSVHGEVQYGNGKVWNRLRVNMDLTSGTQIRTGHDSETSFQIDPAARLILSADSEVDLTEMMVRRLKHDTSTRTTLELRQGAILGYGGKLSPESYFQIRGNGVTAEVRGGDFRLTADGSMEAVAGEMTVWTGGKTYQLHAGEFFDPKKNEVGRLPGPSIFVGTFFNGCVGLDPSGNGLFGPRPVPFVLSPFDFGLRMARHGWVAPAAGN
jgi:hypothetical protein